MPHLVNGVAAALLTGSGTGCNHLAAGWAPAGGKLQGKRDLPWPVNMPDSSLYDHNNVLGF